MSPLPQAACPEALTLFHPAGYLRARAGNPFGKDIANAALFGALARHGGYRWLGVLNQVGARPEQLRPDFFPHAPPVAGIPGDGMNTGPAPTELAPTELAPTEPLTTERVPTELVTAGLWNTALPGRSGVLLRGQPYLAELAWLRRQAGADGAYSLVGLIHTAAPPAVREQIAAAGPAPVHPWDALICTSPAVQQAMEQLFDEQAAHVRERFGGTRFPRPQLPLIPLAVDVERIAAQAASSEARRVLRERLGVPPDGLLVLWVGRLSYYEKAFPQAMFQAVQRAAASTGRRLHLALVGWFPDPDTDQRLYRQAAERLAPDVNVAVLNGNDPALLAQSWAAADVFLSLVDNIQETFGLAPVEAMAAGLPVVVSDWDGYRYTVRDGLDGFLIPTLGAPGGRPGAFLAQLHSLGLEAYQTYVGAVAQHTAVHVGRAADALARLATSAELRTSMGAAGQRRARELFSWPVVVDQYNQLFAELAERRVQARRAGVAPVGVPMAPGRGDPFVDFRGFATTVLQPQLRLQLAAGLAPAVLSGRGEGEGVAPGDAQTQAPSQGPSGAPLEAQRLQDQLEGLLAVKLNTLYPGLRGTPAEALALLARLARLECASGEGPANAEAPDSGPASPGLPGQGMTVAELLADAPPGRRPLLENSLVWLAKLGLMDWLPPSA